MADYYSRREMSLHDERIRRDKGRSNADEFQTLSRSDDHGLGSRDLGTLSRFQWNSLFNESRDGSRSNNGFTNGGRNYDTLVERPAPIVSDGIRNVSAYDPNVDDSRYIGQTRNDTRLSIDDGRNYAVRERVYPERQSVDEVNDHIGRTRNASRVSIEDGRNYAVREREYPQRPSVDEVNDHIGRTRKVSRVPIEDDRNYSITEREYSQRQSVDGLNGLMFGSEDGSQSLTPRSHSSGQRTPSRGILRESLSQEGKYRSVDGIGSSRGIPSSRLSTYYRTSYAEAGGTSDLLLAEEVSPRARGEYAPNVRRADCFVHPESYRSRDDDFSVQGYSDGESYGINVVNATLPRDQYVGNSRRDAVMEEGYSGLHDMSRPLQEAPALDNYDGSRIGSELVYAEVNIGPRISYPDHTTEEIRRSLSLEEQITSEGNTRDVSYEQRYVYVPRQNEEILLMDENTQHIMDVGDFSSPEQPNTIKRRLVFADEMSGAKCIACAVRGVLSYDERHLSAEDEDGLRLSNRISHHRGEFHSRAHKGVSIAEARQPSNGMRKSRQKPLSKSDEGSKGDVMKRLRFPQAVSRPCAPQLPWPKEAKRFKTSPHVINTPSSVETYGNAKGTELKKKLKSVHKPVAYPSTAPDPVVLNSGPNINMQQKRPIKDSGSMKDGDRRLQDLDADRTVLKIKPLNDTPENPEKFKQNVDEWFFKCMVLLIENISYRKRFKSQGIGRRLKCIICSSFKEFCETKDVAAHAFSSLKVGYRAQHLGFHRALCVIMGWDSAAAANGRWVCQSLPESVAWTLREDVIIWPPVVIIQNFPDRNCQLNEIGNLSIELKNILKDKGFTREIKACHEKPGNPNIVVVEFNGTGPGLKEAERLHNSFAENKHGRAELVQLDAEVVYCKVVDKKPDNNRKLVDKSYDDPYPVDKSEDDQEPVHRIKDEQSVHKTEDYQKPIDKRDDENEHMKIDQQLVDKAEDDQEPIGRNRDDLGSIDKVRVDQGPLEEAQGDQEQVEEAQGEQKPVHKSLGDQELVEEAQAEQNLVDKSLGDQELVEEAQAEQNPIDKSQGDQELVEEAQAEQNPIDKSKGDQEQVNKTSDTQGLTENRKDDQEPLDKTGYDQEHVGVADDSKDDQELVEEAQGEQILVGKSKGDQEQANKTGDTQGLTDNRNDDQEPLDKLGYDQEPVGLADNSKIDQEPLDKTTYDEEPAGQKGDDQEPMGRKYNTLYGYLGIVEDLPRLPNVVKRHHLARSKEERLASFNAVI
ncbi:uncharacterized protein LOC141633048 [Silene latifolia]|uniref:uncharacterized protein LOC141633048 n=1 Tax=Silene latifolia TaxID=37657 RepID=UPI003D7873AE